MINWNEPQQINGRTRYLVTCECGNSRWLVKRDALVASQCFQCSQKVKAKKGYAAMTAIYGEKWAARHVQAYRLAHPTPSEGIVSDILQQLGLRFSREYWLATKDHGKRQRVYLIDHMITHPSRGMMAIEINGGCHVNHTQRDRRKMRLLRRRGIPVLVLTTEQIENGQAQQIIQEWVT